MDSSSDGNTEGIEGMQTLLARGGQTRSGALDRERLINAQRGRPAAPSRRAR